MSACTKQRWPRGGQTRDGELRFHRRSPSFPSRAESYRIIRMRNLLSRRSEEKRPCRRTWPSRPLPQHKRLLPLMLWCSNWEGSILKSTLDHTERTPAPGEGTGRARLNPCDTVHRWRGETWETEPKREVRRVTSGLLSTATNVILF